MDDLRPTLEQMRRYFESMADSGREPHAIAVSFRSKAPENRDFGERWATQVSLPMWHGVWNGFDMPRTKKAVNLNEPGWHDRRHLFWFATEQIGHRARTLCSEVGELAQRHPKRFDLVPGFQNLSTTVCWLELLAFSAWRERWNIPASRVDVWAIREDLTFDVHWDERTGKGIQNPEPFASVTFLGPVCHLSAYVLANVISEWDRRAATAVATGAESSFEIPPESTGQNGPLMTRACIAKLCHRQTSSIRSEYFGKPDDKVGKEHAWYLESIRSEIMERWGVSTEDIDKFFAERPPSNSK